MAKLNYKDVIEYFDEVSPDMAELVIGMIQDNLEVKAAKRAKISANLKKARAARGQKSEGAEGATVTTTAQAQPAQRRPGRPARVERVDQQVDPNQALVAGQ